MNESGWKDWVPRLRRRPDSLSDEAWGDFVKTLFPRLSSDDCDFVQVGTDSTLLKFDVISKTGDFSHRVHLRGVLPGENLCNCAAFRYGIYGTCSHIEFAMDRLREFYGDTLAELFRERPYSEIILQHGPRRRILFRPMNEAPRAVLAIARRCFDKQGELILSHIAELQKLIQHLPSLKHEIMIDEEVFAMIALMMQKQWRMRDILAAYSKGAGTKSFDKLLKTPLTSFQREAAINAAIMGRQLLFNMPGLGKRRTVIAAAEILAQHANLRQVLIFTETELLHTWRRELEISTDRKFEIVFGSTASRSRQYAGDAFFKVARYADFKEDTAAITGLCRPDMLVYDHAHVIKHYDQDTIRMLRRLESEYLLILSGLDPVRQPGPFLSFVDMIDAHRIGVLESFLNQHQIPSGDCKSAKYVNMNRLPVTLPDHYRRDETRVYAKNLPDLVEHFRFMPMTLEQGKIHAECQAELFRMVAPWKEEEKKIPPMNVLHRIQVILRKMFKAANDIALLDPQTVSGHKCRIVRKIMSDHFDRPDVRFLVFANDPGLFDIVAQELEAARLDYAIADRRMSSTQQQLSIKKFDREENCRILFADDGIPERLPVGRVHVVIHLDHPWNPDVFRERHQHLNRSSIRPIHVYRLIACGSIEHAYFKAADKIDIKVPVDMSRNQSVTLLDIPQQEKFFQQIKLVLEHLTEGPIIVDCLTE